MTDINQYAMNKNKPVRDFEEKPPLGEVGYGQYGAEVVTRVVMGIDKQEREVDNPHCFCKIITKADGVCAYYIKCGLGKRLFDPYSAMGSARMYDSKYEARTGKPMNEFVAVPEQIFQYYHKYLTTQNSVLFRQCERELHDA